MPKAPEFTFDAASVLSLGQRDHQEDALAIDFPIGAGFGFAVLSDGMGGHAAGDVASKIVVTEVFSELKFQSSDTEALQSDVVAVLKDAAFSANDCMKAHTETHSETEGMGATLLAPVFFGSKLHWISVGDSPLFLFRGNALMQLNEDHSMAPQIDFMLQAGAISEDAAANHPDRNALTSVLFGDEIEAIDCPDEPFQLEDGDIVIAASDGLQYLPNDRICAVVRKNLARPAAVIAKALLDALEELEDPAQDNVSFAVIKAQSRASDRIGLLAAELVRASENGNEPDPDDDSVHEVAFPKPAAAGAVQ